MMKHQNMTKTLKAYSFIIIFAFLNGFSSYSQTHRGQINTIKYNGLHKITLPHQVRAAVKDNFNFLRIEDSLFNEVPYALIRNTNTVAANFNAIKIISKKVIKDSVTSLILDNKTTPIQDHITLEIANTKGYKIYTILGSNDRKNWFGLVANKRLSNLNASKKTSVEKTIAVPLNTYNFLRLDLNDKKSLPIQVLKVGIYQNKFFTQKPIQLHNFTQTIRNNKEKKTTKIQFSATHAHKIDALTFKINTSYFLRKAKLLVTKKRVIKKRVEFYDKVLYQFELNSNHANTFNLEGINENEFSIEIENNDNPPLNIETIRVFQKPIHLIADLKNNTKYTIYVDTTLTKPKYDIVNFISNKIEHLEDASISNFTPVKVESNTTTTTYFWQTKLFMWSCIVLGSMFVVYFSLKLIKDINPKN